MVDLRNMFSRKFKNYTFKKILLVQIKYNL